MKIGDMLVIKGEKAIIKEFERNEMLVAERTCNRWLVTDNVEQMITSGEATLITKGESK